MSFSLATRGHTAAAACAGCLARQALVLGGGQRPGGGMAGGGGAGAATATAGAGTAGALRLARQVRAKSSAARPSGVVVRLLEDVPRFGRKDAILRAERGRMRNVWFPRRLAEYMTPARFAELGLSPATAVGERDALFAGTEAPEVSEDGPSAADRAAVAHAAAAAAAALQAIDPARAAAALAAHLPPALVFRRRAIGDAAAALFGSVSTDDVAAAAREALAASGDAAARLVRVEARDVRFVVEAAEAGAGAAAAAAADDTVAADRVKALGRFEIEIALRGAGSGVAPVRRIVEVVAEA